jgi:uncharacterized membrane protein
LYAALCCFGLFLLRKRDYYIIAGCLLLFAGGGLEIYHQFNFYYPGGELFTLYFVLYGFLWASLVSYAGSRWRWFGHYSYAASLLALSLGIYLVLIPEVYDIQVTLMESGRYMAHFMAHWASSLLVALMIVRLTSWWRQEKIRPIIPPEIFTWISCTVIVIFLSAEIELLVNHLFYSKANSFSVIRTIYYKTGLAILWGLCSFIFMWLGMRNKFKPLRIVSLFLFSITLLKLFLFDIRNIPIAGKIAAFFCLGVLLLVVSFMYQRLKKIIIEDEEKKTV